MTGGNTEGVCPSKPSIDREVVGAFASFMLSNSLNTLDGQNAGKNKSI